MDPTPVASHMIRAEAVEGRRPYKYTLSFSMIWLRKTSCDTTNPHNAVTLILFMGYTIQASYSQETFNLFLG